MSRSHVAVFRPSWRPSVPQSRHSALPRSPLTPTGSGSHVQMTAAFTISPLFHSPSPKFTSAFYSSVVISHMIRQATRRASDSPAPLFPCQLSSKSFRFNLLRTLCALSYATARSKPCVFSCLRTLCRHNGRVGGYDPVENSHVSPANYQLSTVDFPAIPLAAMSGFPVPHQLSRLQRRASRRREGAPTRSLAAESSAPSFNPSSFRQRRLRARPRHKTARRQFGSRRSSASGASGRRNQNFSRESNKMIICAQPRSHSMDEFWKLGGFPAVGDADPVPASVFTNLPEHGRTLALLHDVSRELTAILDREELLRRIANRVKALVDFDVFSVMLWNEVSQHLECVFALKYEDSIPLPMRIPLDQGLTGSAARERRIVRVADVREDSRYVHCQHGVEVRSELVVPLLLQDRLIGVLDLESTKTGAFVAEHEPLLQTLGSYIAVALENARLFEQTRENERRLQQDLDTAREIQLRLLPAGAREVPGLDLGTAAALFASLAIGVLREHTVEHPCPPAEMLAHLNRRLHSGRLQSRFIAMALAVYDAHSRLLTLANAGSPRPLLIRDGVTEVVRVEGIPLGLFPEAQYEEVSLLLRPGDIVILASDGIHEAENTEKEQFGVERLAAAVFDLARDTSAATIAGQILRVTDEHSAGECEFQDDRTILVLRITDEPVAGDDWSKI